jgi:2-(1,2-epoxy-1,2-dihydrophenyl)acetyl-CoA isomerase
MTEDLLTEVTEGVAVLTLNRPDSLNAMSAPMMRALVERLHGFIEDDAVGCIVLTGAGRAFCAGGDVRQQAEGTALAGSTPEARARDLRARMEASRLIHEYPKPTIAMVNGVAAGAGLSIALACDMRIAGASARMTTAFAKVGFSGDFGGLYYLNRLVGTARARELYLTSDILDATQIAAYGLANHVYPDDRLRAETMALATRLARGPRVAYAMMKRNMKIAEEGTLSDLLDMEAIGMSRCRDTDDHREAARAFVEKRTPVFKGR